MEATPVTQRGFSTENLNLRHYWHIVLERRWLVITAFISVLLLSLVYLSRAPRVYESFVRIEVNRKDEGSFSLRDVISGGFMDSDYLQTQYKNLVSLTLLQTVYKKLNLDKDPRYNKEIDPLKELAEDITIAPVRLSRLVDIRVEHTDPKVSALIANTLAEEFVAQNLRLKQKKLFDQLSFLRNEMSRAETAVTTADNALQTYLSQAKVASLDSEKNTIFLALSESQQAYAKAKGEAKTLQNTVEEMDRHVSSGKSLETFPSIATDPLVKQTQSQLISLENELAGLLKKYKDKYPAVLTARSKVRNAEEALQTSAQQVADTLRSQARLAKSNEEISASLLKDWEDRQLAWNISKMQYDVLKNKADTSKTLFTTILTKTKEVELVSSDEANNIRIVDPAREPLLHVKPRVVLTLLLGVLGGIGIAVGLAFFVNYLDDSIKSQEDVETYLKLPFLGYVPNIKSNSIVERDLQAHLHPTSNAAESFRTIRAALSLTHAAEKLRLVSVTSTIPSEGKSLVASNIAIVLAQTGLRTLLVDADLRRPSVHKTFQLHSPVGLAAYLMEKTDKFADLVHTTEVPNLDVICCGAVPTTPSELIGSRRMMQFLQESGKRYDRVVLDCPPVSAVSDPLIIASMSDGIVFVTKFNKIRREHARKTVQRIQDAGIHVFGAVLNDIDFEGKDSYYYSYYYYQNRYYASHYKTQGKTEGKNDPASEVKTEPPTKPAGKA